MTVVILMGVSGSGKSTLGKAYSQRSGWPFFDGDDFHPPENVAKMKAGTPLTDEDRVPWLLSLRRLLAEHLEQQSPMILACSALRSAYREVLQRDDPRIKFVFLSGDFELISQRLAARDHAYMPATLLKSQFETLEPPEDAIHIDISLALEQMLDQLDLHFRRTGP